MIFDNFRVESCTKAHEDYESVDFSAKLGEYAKYAIAADSTKCASIGK
jgi:hypothetical protein